MELLIILIVIALLLFIGSFFLPGLIALGILAGDPKRVQRQKDAAPQLLLDAFDQNRELVTFDLPPQRTHPTKAEVIEFADTFNYRMTGSSEDRSGVTLVFERRDAE